MTTRIILAGCVSKKRPGVHKAQDLYLGALWSRRRAYAEASGCPWFVITAKLPGVYRHDARLKSYDRVLGSLRATTDGSCKEKELYRQWQLHLSAHLRCDMLPHLLGSEVVIEVHAGRKYVEGVEAVGIAGWTVEAPLAGLAIGKQLQWYDRQANPRQGRLALW